MKMKGCEQRGNVAQDRAEGGQPSARSYLMSTMVVGKSGIPMPGIDRTLSQIFQ